MTAKAGSNPVVGSWLCKRSARTDSKLVGSPDDDTGSTGDAPGRKKTAATAAIPSASVTQALREFATNAVTRDICTPCSEGRRVDASLGTWYLLEL
jgi:hypothetical protein